MKNRETELALTTKRKSLETCNKKTQISKVAGKDLSKSSIEEMKDFYLKNYNPKNMLRLFSSVKDISTAISVKADVLSSIRNNTGISFSEAIIKLQLINLNDLVNAKRPLTEVMIEYTSAEIINLYWWFKMTDIYLIFRRMTNGDYGNFYDSLNPTKILSCFSKYNKERTELSLGRSVSKHMETKDIGDPLRAKKEAEKITFEIERTLYKERKNEKNKKWQRKAQKARDKK